MKTYIIPIFTLIFLTSCSLNSKQETVFVDNNETTKIEESVNQTQDTKETVNIKTTQNTGENKIVPPNGIKLTDIENKLKSAKDISVILNLSCEISLYPGYKPGDNTSHMDYNIIKKCYDLVRKYEKSYYEKYITIEPKDKFPMPNNFNKEYEEYKKTVWKYEDYLKQFKDTDTTASKDTCDTATTGADATNCGPVSREEFSKSMGRVMPYSEFEKMKQNEINSQRENMMKEQKRYKEILEGME